MPVPETQREDSLLSRISIRRAEWATAVLLTLAAVTLHVMATTSAGPLWRDEANTVGLATLPTMGDVWKNLQYESFPLLWIVILREFSALMGPMNDSALRALGFSVGVGIVAVLWFNARTFKHAVPLFSLALLALSPSLIVWGDSVRAYGFGILLILLTGALLWRFVDEPTTGRFVMAGLAAIASVQTLYYNSVLLLAFCAGAVAVAGLKGAWKSAGLVVFIGCLAAVSIVPYVVPMRNSSSWTMLVQIDDYDLTWFREQLNATLSPAGSWVLSVWVLLSALAIIVGVRAVRLPGWLGISQRQRGVALFSIVTLTVGAVGIFVFLDNLNFLTQPWYYLTLLALVAVCIDSVFGAVIHTPPFRIARLVVVLCLAGATFLPAMEFVRHRMTNVDLVASRLREIGQPGDLVLVDQWYMGVTFDRYYRGAAHWMTVPPIGFYRFHRYDIVKEQMMWTDQTLPARKVTAQAGDALRAGHRVFIVGGLSSGVPRRPPLPPAPLPGDNPWPTNSYLTQWSLMVGNFLRQHSTTLLPVHVEARGLVNGYENAQLFVASGWRP